MSIDASATTLAILAGGAGSRMGMPKALLTVRGRSILEYLVSRVRWPGPTLLVTTPGREKPPGHTLFSHEVVDPTPDQGPLRGLLTALEGCTTPLLIVGTVDMPCVGSAHCQLLITCMESRPGCVGLMLDRATDGVRRIEPFPSVFRVEARDAVAAELAAGSRSVQRLFRHPGFVVTAAPSDWPERTWTNLNYPHDLQRFLDEPG